MSLSSEEITHSIHAMGAQAKKTAHVLSTLSSEQKTVILQAMASGLRAATEAIVIENAKDIAVGEENQLSPAMLDRLRLNVARIDAIAAGIEQVAKLVDPVGDLMDEWDRPNGIHIQQVRVPIGVIGIIYESRPNVTSDAAVLCLKSGNATILRGGKEAIHSNRAIAKALQTAGESAGLPEGAIQLIPFTDRESVTVLAQMDQYLDLIIPRGGKGLIEAVVSQARMPVIKHYDGICHTYLHNDADFEMATKLVVDAKTQKPSVCNALETLLVHEDVAASLLPEVAAALSTKSVEIRGCEKTLAILGDQAIPAHDEDWDTEYLDYIISVKVVAGIDRAIDHINAHSSQHSECIVTQDAAVAQRFMRELDSACVFHNVSTRFADGEEFGFGAEIGISTDKLHARGPMGLKELTSYQYRITGRGQTKG